MVDREFEDSALFAKLLGDADAIEEDGKTFIAEYALFIERPVDVLAKILRSHLLVEHYLDLYLAASNPSIQDWSAARLTFLQKLALAGHDRSVVRVLAPGLKKLNALRNRAAHTLEANIVAADIGPITEFVTMWHRAGGKSVPTAPIDLVETFTLLACNFLSSAALAIQRHGGSKGLLGLLDWWKEPENP